MNLPIVPRRAFLTSGVGHHIHKLMSFELALRDAGISSFNLVRVSSIWPPGCRLVTQDTGLRDLKPGQVVFTVLAERASNEPGQQVSAAVGLAVPEDASEAPHHGYLAEVDACSVPAGECGEHAEALAAEMLFTLMDVKVADMKTLYRVASAQVEQPNDAGSLEWCTVVSAMVFCSY